MYNYVIDMQRALQDISHATFMTELCALTKYAFSYSVIIVIDATALPYHSFRHPNLICLIGFCKSEPALVYRPSLFHVLHEYKVSLHCNNVTGMTEEESLQVENPLTWTERLDVLCLTAYEIPYLHSSTPS